MANSISDLSVDLSREYEQNQFNPCVGQILVSENERTRIWYIHLKPGERVGFHRHVLDYSWTCLTAGRAASHIGGGAPVEREYTPGETRHMTYASGEFMVHDLMNTGATDLAFITIELLESANTPLPLPAGIVPTGIIPAVIRFMS